MTPSLFLSHGAPDRILSDHPAQQFLQGLPELLPSKPAAIVVISAHWQSRALTLTATGNHQVQYDFGGFAQAMHDIQYPAQQPQWLTDTLQQALAAAGITVHIRPRPLDHGVWTLLKPAYPAADIPVAELSLPVSNAMSSYTELGAALAPLAKRNILIIGSGSASHNLGQLNWDNSQPQWVTDYIYWLQEKVAARDLHALTHMYQQAPHAHRAHPTAEHYLPLLVAVAAGGNRVQLLHDSYELGTLNNSSWAFWG